MNTAQIKVKDLTSVRSQGPAILPSIIGYIFTKFVRYRASLSPTGINSGLAINSGFEYEASIVHLSRAAQKPAAAAAYTKYIDDVVKMITFTTRNEIEAVVRGVAEALLDQAPRAKGS